MQVLNKRDIPGRFNVALIISRFHGEVAQKLLNGALERLQELGFESDQITSVWVPGALEIPLTAQRLASTGGFAAIICLGAVIARETRGFECIIHQVSQGCMQVSLSQDIPVIFGVLTTDDIEQAHERVGGVKGHAGRHAVDSAFELISVLQQI